MKKIHLLAPLAVCVLVQVFPVYPQSTNPDSRAVILEIRYEGPRRTKTEVIDDVVGLSPGDPVSAVDEDRITSELRRTGLFEDIEFQYVPTEDGTVLIISMVEKWAFIPIPVLSVGNGGFSVGAFLYDANFQGRRRMLFLGGVWSPDSWNSVLGFVNPSAWDRVSLSLTGAAEFGVVEDTLMDGSRERIYRASSLSLGNRFRFRTDAVLQPGLGHGLRVVSPDERWNDEESTPDGAMYYLPRVFFVANRTEFREFFEEGVTVYTEYEAGVPLQGEKLFHSVGSSAAVNGKVFPRSRLGLVLSGEVSDRPAVMQTRPSGPGFRTVPSGSYATQSFWGGAAEYELPVFTPGWGTVTLLGYYEAGGASVESFRVFHGPGGGFRVYLARVAIPAVGFDMSYNQATRAWSGSFSLGMQM
jgi:hypothetical protein